ncbi:WXG100 family type VII secretion target [Nocardia salmonicida]|uniref:WXG100 family type VII secretion target n=1 Tax=Nocardia salmonicida TaxID=53431 RepID=UPI00104235BD|nr:WXG100 family type VII secretion target [Nocardia salmonicida]
MRSISGRTDVDYVSVVEVFDNLSHGEIHSAVRQLDPAALAGAAETFLTAATGLGDGVEIAHGEIRAAIADGWRGAAAQQASDAVRDFEQAGRRIADVLTAVGVRLSQAGDAAESIRTAIAEPAGAQPDPAAALLDSEQAATNATLTREAENARLDAVQAMETIYAGAFLPTGSGVPAFTGITTDTGTTASGVAPSGAVPSAGIPQAATPGVVASSTAPATIAATVPAGSAPVVSSAGTTSTSNGVLSTNGNATAPAGSTPGTTPATTTATTTPAAVTGPGRPVTDSAKKASTAPASITPATSSAFPGKVSAVSRPRPAADTATASATGQVADASAGSDGRQEPTVTGGEAAAGMGAGAVGGMMGGAIAAADQARPSGGPRPAQPVDEPEDEDDEFLRFLEEEPTYLEPADEVNALIGKLDPTSPAVLGEWTERE